MKRHTVLQPLSRQHHSLLLAALLLKKGIAKNTESSTLFHFIQQMWEQEIIPHFYAEDNELIPVVRNFVPSEIIEKIIAEHNAVREIFDQLKHQPNVELLRQFAQQLEQNIRNEERIYFSEIQQHITKEKEQLLATKIIDSKFTCIHFKPAFWE